jgi:ribonuclease E
VAIYILNQKRHELSRIETEHGMEISFEPKEGLAAGSFELERTKSRDPGERPRNAAVSIEAGFVPSTEPEPDYQEEVDEEERIEIEDQAADSEETPVSHSFERPEGSREKSEGKGRRRRRGGRGRNRERPEGQPQRSVEAAEGVASEAVQSEEQADGPYGGPNADGQNEAQPSGQTSGQPVGENGEPRRRRRRRRGRRGGRERGPQGEGVEHAQTGFANEADRFGAVPDEIDTTPSDNKHAPAAVPSWTPTDDIPDTTPADDASKAVKKGWWQRTFSGE